MIKILDCTLRDGGYINDFDFGKDTIKSIISRLGDANIDMIEVGFLSSCIYNQDYTFFPTVESFRGVIQNKKKDILYIGMIAIGEKEISTSKIPHNNNDGVDAIRVTFHKNEIHQAIHMCKDLMHKEYKVFMQPIGTSTYADSELLKLIQLINEVNPYAFAIVDTLGSMSKNETLRLFRLFDHNLKEKIAIGFHSHNNLQLSFSNAQALTELQTKRDIIIDSSVFGMGRGAGNLSTELITRHLNHVIDTKYNILPLLEIIDEHLMPIFSKKPWGYSMPYYLSAQYKCHPNYAARLLNKQTISMSIIDTLLKCIPIEERAVFNKRIIDNIYNSYQNKNIDDKSELERLKKELGGKSILIVAPGKSITEENETIREYISEIKPVVISVNFDFENIPTDYVFISNIKRYTANKTNFKESTSLIMTSNISSEGLSINEYNINYSSLLINDNAISDNAGMMLINMLTKLSVKNICLAGFDGFTENVGNNFFDDKILENTDTSEIELKNIAIKKFLQSVNRKMSIKFITKSIYQ